MRKRGEKSLQMIFGLFILLIISLVVLSLFFKFVNRGGKQLEGAGTNYARQAAKDEAGAKCEALCAGIEGTDTIIEFCKQLFKIDWNEDGVIEGPAVKGRWHFCEKKVPCFVLVPNCKYGTYDGNKCVEMLSLYSRREYMTFFNDVKGNSPDVDRSGGPLNASNANGDNENIISFEDGCDLPHSGSCLESDPGCTKPDGKVKTFFNWKERFCFNATPDTIIDGQNGWDCPTLPG